MREIKFRAWDKTNRIMNDCHHVTGLAGFMHSDTPESALMQFTGLLDKSGKEIYEGDIISDGKSKMAVKFENGAFVFDDDTYEDGNGDDVATWALQGEIIGNRFENPELLTKEM